MTCNLQPATCNLQPATGQVLKQHFFLPSQWLLLVAIAALCFINLVPLGSAMETWYTKDGCGGFEIDDAPTGAALRGLWAIN